MADGGARSGCAGGGLRLPGRSGSGDGEAIRHCWGSELFYAPVDHKNPATPAPSSRSGTYSTSPARAAQPIGISSSATDHPRPTPGPAPPEFHLAIQPAHQRQQLPAGGLRGRPAADRALGFRRNLQRQHRGELREPASRRRPLLHLHHHRTSCAWQLGGPDIPGTTNTFGGTSAPEVGMLHD